MSNYKDIISLLNPTKFVNDENINKPLIELKNNIDYILHFIDGNKTLLSGVFGNLLDFDKTGKRITENGGVFDSYKKVHLWTALNNFEIANDQELSWLPTNNMMVYRGIDTTNDKRRKWIEREIYIPETLRNQQLIFSIKAGFSSSKDQFNIIPNHCEHIGIEIVGAEEPTRVFSTFNKWESHKYYENENIFAPELKTFIFPFKTAKFSDKIKIKILRTATSGNSYFCIEKIFIGFLPIPYWTQNNKYSIDNLDINELYDFHNNYNKALATALLGHKIAEQYNKNVGNDLITWFYLNLFIRNVLYFGSKLKTTLNIPDAEKIFYQEYLDIENILDEMSGVVNCNTTDKEYTIPFGHTFDEPPHPTITIECPSKNHQVIFGNVYNVTTSQFSVVLSNTPPDNGYKIHWNLGSMFSVKKALKILNFPPDFNNPIICPTPNYPTLFDYEVTE